MFVLDLVNANKNYYVKSVAVPKSRRCMLDVEGHGSYMVNLFLVLIW